jgi:hypothetical protein
MSAPAPTCSVCGEVLRSGFDALVHAFEHGAEHRDELSPIARAVADDVERGEAGGTGSDAHRNGRRRPRRK